jgi:hypothetical protein
MASNYVWLAPTSPCTHSRSMTHKSGFEGSFELRSSCYLTGAYGRCKLVSMGKETGSKHATTPPPSSKAWKRGGLAHPNSLEAKSGYDLERHKTIAAGRRRADQDLTSMEIWARQGFEAGEQSEPINYEDRDDLSA